MGIFIGDCSPIHARYYIFIPLNNIPRVRSNFPLRSYFTAQHAIRSRLSPSAFGPSQVRGFGDSFDFRVPWKAFVDSAFGQGPKPLVLHSLSLRLRADVSPEVSSFGFGPSVLDLRHNPKVASLTVLGFIEIFLLILQFSRTLSYLL
jgi:hypothetical protein